MTHFILSNVADGVMTLTINRPEKRNALLTLMYEALATGLGTAQSDPAVRAVLLRGEGENFCAGNDVGDFSARNSDFASSAGARFLRALVALEKPLVAAVRGPAVGVGTTMLLHCDLVYV